MAAILGWQERERTLHDSCGAAQLEDDMMSPGSPCLHMSPRFTSFRVLGPRSSSMRISSFGRDVVIPALKRQGSAILATTCSSSRSCLRYREPGFNHSSCFGHSWRWTSTALGAPESPTSNLLKNSDAEGGSAAAEDHQVSFTTSPDQTLISLPAGHEEALVDEAPAGHGNYIANLAGDQPKPLSVPGLSSISFVQSRRSSGSAAWGNNICDQLTTASSLKRFTDTASFDSVAGGAWARKNSELRTPSLKRFTDTASFDSVAGTTTTTQWGMDQQQQQRFKAAPKWKQLLKELRAKANLRNIVHPVPAREWTNYDAQSYAKNFDNGGGGCGDDDSNGSINFRFFSSSAGSYLEDEEEEVQQQLGLRETALHTALLHKFHSARYDSSAVAAALSRAPSMPVKPVPAPYHPKQQDSVVPLWQRRNLPAPTQLQLIMSPRSI